jgi:predicted metal-binding membrane protein
MTAGRLEKALKRDRRIVLGAIALLIMLSWAYVLLGAGTGMSPFAMTSSSFPPFVTTLAGMVDPQPWSAAYWVIMLMMWWVMMIAMMTPSAAPMVLLHTTITRRGSAAIEGQNPALATFAFVGGYLTIWLVFALVAASLEAILERLYLVSPMFMWSESPQLTGILLLLAGAYQFTPLKSACLDGCRSPIEFLSRHWRKGGGGAFRIGVIHGAYCVGCCWALMLLLFAGGVMNLLWIAGLSIAVLIEKTFPFGRAFGRAIGLLALAGGAFLLVSPLFHP